MSRPRQTGATRRNFIVLTGALAAGHVLPTSVRGAQDDPSEDEPVRKIAAATIAEAELLAGISFTDEERAQIAASIGDQIETFEHRRSIGWLPNDLAPAMVFDPRLPGQAPTVSDAGPSTWSEGTRDLPTSDREVAFAPVTDLAQWIRTRRLTSERLTRIYLDRLREHGRKLECVVELTEALALEQARRADREIAQGRYRGPLHGIPWGAKDLLDTKGIRTTWGATPYRDRVAEQDAAVVRLLADAGAVLVAKLTLGALAYGDIWYGGKTRNPFNLEQGSSGSSAGPAAATTAGLVGFSIGTETYGSIVSPSMRCGTTGLRPTFGRVPRTGAMALCWSLDKIGPICRTVEDCAMVLEAINGYDDSDAASIDMPFSFDARRSTAGIRVGYAPEWFEGERVSDIDRHALGALKRTGVDLVEIEPLPDRPYDALLTILIAEAAAAFEELTRTDQDDTLVWQEPEAWPNTFRRAWFIPAIELVQAERLRRQVMELMAAVFEQVDLLFSPSFAASLLLITNHTGHPSLTLRAGLKDDGTPHGVTLWGRLFDEATLCTAGRALERELDVWHRQPSI